MNEPWRKILWMSKYMWKTHRDTILTIISIIFVAAVIAAAIVPQILSDKRQEALREAGSLLSFEGGILSIAKRDALFKKVISIVPHHSYTATTKPKEYVYTSVTVSSVTTGGVHEEGGYNYVSSTCRTAKWDLQYKNRFKEVIYRIQLTPALAEEARKCAQIKGFLNKRGQIVVSKYIPMSASDRQAYLDSAVSGSAKMYNIQSKYSEMAAPSFEECKTIMEWLCGKEPTKD